MKLYLQNFGCKVNAVETESIAALLREQGWDIVSVPESADAVILNSCTVTASGDHRMLTALRRIRQNAPDAAIVLTGCYVQAFPEDAAALSEADILVGTKERGRIPALLDEFFRLRKPCRAIAPYGRTDAFEVLPISAKTAHTRAFLKIQDGCNRFCSYCIIPYARGRCRSLPLAAVRQQAEAFRQRGYQEIVLCGINLACYGQEEDCTIADAVEACADFPRIRLGSLEPDGLTDAVLARLAANPAFCPQFHISLQSGCNRTLKAMHRQYTCEEYAQLLRKIRALFPDCAITTDIMTGFPDETEEDFAQTLAFAEKMQFAKIHIFRYSRRSGTLADKLPSQIPEQVKKERADRLSALEQRMAAQFLQSHVGKTVSVLFEREKTPEFHTGHARDYTTVQVPATPTDGSFRNRIAAVRITDAAEGKLYGEIV